MMPGGQSLRVHLLGEEEVHLAAFEGHLMACRSHHRLLQRRIRQLVYFYHDLCGCGYSDTLDQGGFYSEHRKLK